MNIAVRLSSYLVKEAKKYAPSYFRSTSKQIEYWAFLGKIADQNPDLPVKFIKECVESKAELNNSEISKFEFINK